MLLKTKSDMHRYYHERCIAYGRTFVEEGPYVQTILADLEKFCRGSDSAFHPDPRIHALLEGRREVLLRIKEFATMNADQLMDKYSREPETTYDKKEEPRK